jgi:hypothetical protein
VDRIVGLQDVHVQAAPWHLSPKTVEHHVASIYGKLGIHTRAEAVAAAYRLGLIPSSPQDKVAE